MKKMVIVLWGLLVFAVAPVLAEARETKWPGVDEAVVEKFAGELGREARAPYINTDQGDLLLFVFTLAGAIGGFIMGYNWHKIFVAGKPDKRKEN